jgi:hypothetical protein
MTEFLCDHWMGGAGMVFIGNAVSTASHLTPGEAASGWGWGLRGGCVSSCGVGIVRGCGFIVFDFRNRGVLFACVFAFFACLWNGKLS